MSGDGTDDGADTADGRDGDAVPEERAGSANWRCAWCEKPHEHNDPPCDNCGHHKFERAVVPVAPEREDYEREPVWVCPECGRQHQKNSPPCSRCGNATLDRRVPSDDDYADELGGTSYFDLLEPQYVAGFAFALLAGGVLVLAMLGFVTLPGMGGDSLAVSDVPGNATTADGLSLADVESEYVAALNGAREDANASQLSRSGSLDDVARFYNQRRVKTLAGEGTLPGDDRLREAIGGACETRAQLLPFSAFTTDGLASYDSERAVAQDLLAAASVGDSDATTVGVDVHALPDGGVSVTVLTC